MKKLILMMVFAAVSFGAAAQKWTPLFNGKDLNGWVLLNGKVKFAVEDGTIVGYSERGQPNTFLATENSYGDFILEFEFMAEDGINSGVQIRSMSIPEYKNGRVHGYQYEIDTAPRAWSAGLYEEGANRGWLYPLTLNEPARTAYRNGEWNKARVEAFGTSIRTWLNGVECASLVDDVFPEGFVALQIHGIGDPKLEGLTCRWRDIRICTKKPQKFATPANPAVETIDKTVKSK